MSWAAIGLTSFDLAIGGLFVLSGLWGVGRFFYIGKRYGRSALDMHLLATDVCLVLFGLVLFINGVLLYY